MWFARPVKAQKLFQAKQFFQFALFEVCKSGYWGQGSEENCGTICHFLGGTLPLTLKGTTFEYTYFWDLTKSRSNPSHFLSVFQIGVFLTYTSGEKSGFP